MEHQFFVTWVNPVTGRKQYLSNPTSRFWVNKPSYAFKFCLSAAKRIVVFHNMHCSLGHEYFIEVVL